MRTFFRAPARLRAVIIAAALGVWSVPAAQARPEFARLSPPVPTAPAVVVPEEHPGEDEDAHATLEELRARLSDADRITALNALRIALDEVGDGATFVWHKRHRQLKGIIRPTSAFRDAEGRVCRHVIYALKLADYVKQIETIACRQPDGRWSL